NGRFAASRMPVVSRSSTMTPSVPRIRRFAWRIRLEFLHVHEPSPMNVFTNTVVTISFKLFDASNRLIEQADEPIAYLHGSHSGIFPKIEEALNQKKVGESI